MTKSCNHCGCQLNEVSWAVGNVRKRNYICRKCDSIKGKRNRLKRLALQLSSYTLKNYSKVKEGYVYVISNPAWPDWVKVGMAIDADDRCSSYQTSSPLRDYVLHCAISSDDRRKDESTAHKRLDTVASDRRGEWFKMSVEEATDCITGIRNP